MALLSWIVLGFLAGLVGGWLTGARQARGCLPRIVVGHRTPLNRRRRAR